MIQDAVNQVEKKYSQMINEINENHSKKIEV